MGKFEKVKAQIEEILKENDLILVSDDPFCGVLLADNQTGEAIEMEQHPVFFYDVKD
ncbi:hypothetical protein FINN_74 [Bacillus phage Finn]|uniref:Uncharacterized protein n=1 Tax=Bacillus phage Finn TaxID=2884419 RepID=M1I9H7_9CAUD|nr:hypothetical protein FINN_74 [Bacillus phage Finn]AGE61067.1 hypothetical protein FINN_74 [Bacillus phage Finn]